MSTPAASRTRLQRAREAFHRGRAWAADYGWFARAVARGLASPEVPHGYGHGWLRPVLLIPGVLEEWTLLRPVGDRLSRAGHPVHVLPELRRNTIGVVEGAALASAYLALHDLREVVIVAHSKGGLIGKRVLLDDAEHRVHHLVAIATPFAGSTLARLVPSRPVRAMQPDDATIVDLQRHREVNHLITSICPAYDPHIPVGSYLAGATNLPVAASGHFSVLADPEVLDAVLAAAR
ncbi:MAG: hypothetical protein QM804_06630 [Propionicimonas sp.]